MIWIKIILLTPAKYKYVSLTVKNFEVLSSCPLCGLVDSVSVGAQGEFYPYTIYHREQRVSNGEENGRQEGERERGVSKSRWSFFQWNEQCVVKPQTMNNLKKSTLPPSLRIVHVASIPINLYVHSQVQWQAFWQSTWVGWWGFSMDPNDTPPSLVVGWNKMDGNCRHTTSSCSPWCPIVCTCILCHVHT